MAVDLIECTEPAECEHIASRPDNIVQKVIKISQGNSESGEGAGGDGIGNEFFIFVVNIMVPGPPFICMVFYYSPRDPSYLSDGSPFAGLLSDFLDGDDEASDEFRDGRFKLIPSIVKGAHERR